MALLPLFPSLVAVIVAEPAAFAVTRPLTLMVATVVPLLTHVIVRPVSTFPAESLVVTDSCAVWPTTRLFDAGLTVTEATGAGGGGGGGGGGVVVVTVMADVSASDPPRW